ALLLDGNDANGFLRRSSKNDDPHLLRRIPEAEEVVHGRDVLSRLAIHELQDVADLETAGFGGPAGPDIRNDHVVVSRQAERFRHPWCDRLKAHPHFLPSKLA